jgi:Ca2+-binding EF-hand superfamily protein
MNTLGRTSLILACSLALCAAPRALANSHAEQHFKMMDANGDGKVSRAEHAAGAKKMFQQCDANRDGIVTAKEMDAAMAKQGVKAGDDDKSSAEKIRVIDQNGDGKLTTAEHEAGTEKMFGKMDTNSDGFLSKQECDEGMKMMKKGA